MELAGTTMRNYLTGLTAPVDDTDAVNKAYVDKHFSPIKHIYDAEETIYTLSADDMAQKLMFHIASGSMIQRFFESWMESEAVFTKEERESFVRMRQLNALRMEQKSAIAQENFERAAELRDEIRRLESEGGPRL